MRKWDVAISSRHIRVLYLKMLSSIGVSVEEAESRPALPSIQRINDHLRLVVEEGHFSVACALSCVGGGDDSTELPGDRLPWRRKPFPRWT